MNIKISKTEAEVKVKEFFKDIKKKGPKEIKKIKRLAMNKKISLKPYRKLFCKKCYIPYKNPRTRIKNKIKSVTCENCDYTSRWKL